MYNGKIVKYDIEKRSFTIYVRIIKFHNMIFKTFQTLKNIQDLKNFLSNLNILEIFKNCWQIWNIFPICIIKKCCAYGSRSCYTCDPELESQGPETIIRQLLLRAVRAEGVMREYLGAVMREGH